MFTDFQLRLFQDWSQIDTIGAGLTVVTSPNLNLSFVSEHWMLVYLLPYDTELVKQLRPRFDSDVYLLDYNSSVNWEVSELFSMQGKKATIQPVFDGKTLLQDIQQKWERRTDLSSITFNIGVTRHSPFTEYPLDWDFNDNSEIHGLVMDILWKFQSMYGFKMELKTSLDGEWGSKENGSWTGLMGMAVRGDIDIIATSLSMTVPRSKGTIV